MRNTRYVMLALLLLLGGCGSKIEKSEEVRPVIQAEPQEYRFNVEGKYVFNMPQAFYLDSEAGTLNSQDMSYPALSYILKETQLILREADVLSYVQKEISALCKPKGACATLLESKKITTASEDKGMLLIWSGRIDSEGTRGRTYQLVFPHNLDILTLSMSAPSDQQEFVLGEIEKIIPTVKLLGYKIP